MSKRRKCGGVATGLAAIVLSAFVGLSTLGTVATPASAQTASERISFPRGKTGTVITDQIRGYETAEYVLDVSAGQRVTVGMRTSNSSSYFNVTAPGASEATFNGAIDGDSFDTVIPSSGSYRITVYLMRNAARRNETARYSLSVKALGKPMPPPQDDYADGLSGGPDWWQVDGVAYNDTLNIRNQPSTRGRVVAQMRNGEPLRNLGCRMTSGQRWCRVETRRGVVGWANGRFLREGSGQ